MSIKEIAYILFAINYKLGSIFPIKKNFVFSIITHDGSENGNIRTLTDYMCRTNNYTFYYMDKEETKAFFHLLFVLPFVMSRAEIILMDNAFMPMSFFKVRKKTKVLQLWHGTGSIKKFGQDSNTGRLKELEKRINNNIDYLFVNSERLIEEYAGAFGIDKSKVYVTGLPRTDWLLKLINDEKKLERLDIIKNKISKSENIVLNGKKIILYAPTFRDDEVDSPKLHLNIAELMESLPENVILFLKLHPFISGTFNCSDLGNRVVNVSDYTDLNELMAASDGLITDYSSLIFDYLLLDKPVYFFADDLAEFSLNGRGFYLDYNKELPGFLAGSELELGDRIVKDLSGNEDEEFKLKREIFVIKYYTWLDGNSAKRVYETAIKEG
nr:CDP-glycerol glycerophosphotransferase family protein [uncultured Catonella sp.]